MSNLVLWGTQALGFLIQVLPPAWITIYFFRGQYRYSFRRVRRIFAGVLAAEALLFATVSMGFYHAGFGQVYLAANLVFACCVAACFCLLARLARAGLENERSRQSLRLQEQQYAGMRDSIEQTRRQRHDLEHHFALLSVWSQKEENLPRIREYLEEYLEESADAAEKFCKNMAANAVLSYYARELGEAGIDFRAKVSLPERLWIKNVHLSVLFGNALKNALEACGKCLEEGMEVPRVFLQAAVIQHALVLRMENSACQKTWKDEGGWHSSRRDGYGTGLSAIEETAGLYHGSMEIEQKPGTFILKAVLYEEGCL